MIGLSISARTLSTLEIESTETAGFELPCGKPGTRKLTVICRRDDKEGLVAPTTLQIAAPFQARFVGQISEENQDGIVITKRDITIDIPPSTGPGVKTAELIIQWEKTGRTEHRPIVWTVMPAVKVTPAAIIVQPGTNGSLMDEIVIESTGAEFRILAVKGKALAAGFQTSGEKARLHRLKVSIDTEAIGISDLIIETDHPDQAITKISILVPSSPKSAEEVGGIR